MLLSVVITSFPPPPSPFFLRHHGLDYYLLETPVNEVYATNLLKLKRCILLAMARETLYPDDPVRRKEVLDKYEKFRMPEEIADWHGLPIYEVNQKSFLILFLFGRKKPLYLFSHSWSPQFTAC